MFNKDLTNGPRLWDAVLDAVKFPGAVVAGGCIRDWCLSIEPKDIDIFVPCADLKEWLEFKYAIVARGTNLSDILDTAEGQEYNKTDFERSKNPLYGVLEGQLLGFDVNIIARTSHTSNQALIDLFDFDILQAYYTACGDRKFYWNPGQAIALQRQVATLTHDKHIEQSITRFMRFNARHPGLLSLNIPFGNTNA